MWARAHAGTRQSLASACPADSTLPLVLQALLTVVLQGSTMRPLLRVLGYLDLSGAERAVQRAAAQAVDQYGKQASVLANLGVCCAVLCMSCAGGCRFQGPLFPHRCETAPLEQA